MTIRDIALDALGLNSYQGIDMFRGSPYGLGPRSRLARPHEAAAMLRRYADTGIVVWSK